jgi:maleate isomerase
MAHEVPTVRARIGLIIPSSNVLSELHFRRYAPEGVQVHITRLRMTGASHVPLPDLLPRIEEAALALADARSNVIVFHCTGSSMEAGLAAERRVTDTIARATGRQATTTASALLEAMRALSIRKVVLISPYGPETNAHETEFLAQAGVAVLKDRAMNLGGSDGYISAPPALWLQVTQEEADPRADAYFLSCTNIHSPDVIEELEARLQKPVITSNQATLWYCLRACGLSDAVPGLGQLMKLGLPAADPLSPWERVGVRA